MTHGTVVRIKGDGSPGLGLHEAYFSREKQTNKHIGQRSFNRVMNALKKVKL